MISDIHVWYGLKSFFGFLQGKSLLFLSYQIKIFFDKLSFIETFIICETQITKKTNDKNFFPTKQLSWYISKISKPFFNKQGFVKSYIIDNWKEIVGEEYYKNSIPEKLRIQKGGGVLTIATDGATSTEMEYIKTDIIQKINDYYGYRAVNRIRFRNSFIQNEIKENKSKKENSKNKNSKNERVDAFLDKVEESELKEAINSLGKIIIGKNNK